VIKIAAQLQCDRCGRCLPEYFTTERFERDDRNELRAEASSGGWHRFSPKSGVRIGDFCPSCSAGVAPKRRKASSTPASSA
jgi:hypothetical protein